MDVTLPERSVLLTEVLEETLGQKLSRWRKATTTDTFGSRQKQNRTLEKLSICQQLADAMEHIHSHNIAYRDLKPENVGFLGATLKLFDFGLSREMTAEGKHDDPTISMGVESKTPSSSSSLSSSLRTLTPTPTPSSSSSSSLLRGRIGTMRYMAPEVCLDKPYDCDCDLYSYSILCWEVWTHKTPFLSLTPAAYKERVCQKGLRPPEAADVPPPPNYQKRERHNRDSEPVSGVVPESISVLLEKGWVRDPKLRIRWPSIRQELSRIRQDEQKLLQGEAL
jgi:serine/threonine protein kinase